MERGIRLRATRILSGAVLLTATLGPARARGEQPASRSFEITASRIQFQPARLEVNEGDAVRLTLRSTDTTHGFGIKELKVAAVVPKGGEPVTVEFVADQAGAFEFFCTEYCGAGRRGTKGTLGVLPRSAPPTLPPSPSPVQAASGADDLAFDPAEPEVMPAARPTTLPRLRLVLRLTRGPRGEGIFGDLAADLCLLDAGAPIAIALNLSYSFAPTLARRGGATPTHVAAG